VEAIYSPRPAIDPIDLDTLAGSLDGRLVLPGDADYETGRQVHQAAVDAYPLAIVRAANARDVAHTVLFARDNDLELAVRGGGHSLAGHSTVDGGIVLDLGDMRGLHIDPDARLAWAQPGLTAIEYTAAAAAHGLATPFGDSGSVGIAGLTLGGGIGWLVRKHGLTIDALKSVEIVTADGRQLVASEDENPDLFWAVRGGGGNFGVVTRFQFRLYDIGMILGGMLVMPATADVLRSLVPISASAPRELTTIGFFMDAAPPMPFIAPEHHGKPVIAIMFVYAGDPDAGAAAIAPFRAVATPLGEVVAPMPYPAIYGFTEDASARGAAIMRSAFLDTLDDATIDAILAAMAAAPRRERGINFTQIRILGGAMADIPADATAFAHRNAPVMIAIHGGYEGDRAPAEAWADDFFAAIAPKASGVYSNFLEDEGDGRVREAYPAGTHDRLVAAKRRYDPSNLFRRNQNIRPR
jgi:FAD/FMN-containing dehydrogenase